VNQQLIVHKMPKD